MSSLLKALEARFGKQVKLAGFSKKLQTFRSMEALTANIESYLDDRTKTTYPDTVELNNLDDQQFIDALFSNAAILRDGKEQVNELEDVHIYASGFLSDVLGFRALDSDNKEALLTTWDVLSKGIRDKGKHMVFSLDPRISAHYQERGVGSQGVLISNVERTLMKYEEQFYPDDRIGYVAGFHADRHHPHLHVVFLPRTENGNKFNISHLAEFSENDRMDFQGYIKREFNRECWNSYLQYVLEPEVTNSIESPTQVSRFATRVLSNFAALDEVKEMSEEQRAGLLPRDYIPLARREILASPARETSLKFVQSRRHEEFVGEVTGTIVRPELEDASEKPIKWIEDADQIFSEGIELISTREERLKEMLAGNSSANKPNTDSAEKEQWDSFLKDRLPVGGVLCELAGGIYSETIGSIREEPAPHIDAANHDLEFDPSPEEVLRDFNYSHQVYVSDVVSRRSPYPEKEVINSALFDLTERTYSRSAVLNQTQRQTANTFDKALPLENLFEKDSGVSEYSYDEHLQHLADSNVAREMELEPTYDEISELLKKRFSDEDELAHEIDVGEV